MQKRAVVGAVGVCTVGIALAAGACSAVMFDEQPALYASPYSMSSTQGSYSSTSSGFDPSRNRNEELYGPPPSEREPQDADESSNSGFDPRENEMMTLYGPPEVMGARPGAYESLGADADGAQESSAQADGEGEAR